MRLMDDSQAESCGALDVTPCDMHKSSIVQIKMLLENEMFSNRVDGVHYIDKHDILVRTSNVPAERLCEINTGKTDLLVHSAFLYVTDIRGPSSCSFKRIEMVEASSQRNLVGYSDRYKMGLVLAESACDKPNDFFRHGETYRLRMPLCGKNIVRENIELVRRFSRAIADEARFIKSSSVTYGSGLDNNYNCNTFVANILRRMYYGR